MIENISIFDFEMEDADICSIDSMNTYIRTGEAPDEFFETGTFYFNLQIFYKLSVITQTI